MRYKTIEQQVQELHLAGYSIRGIAFILRMDKSKVQRIVKAFQNSPEYPGVTVDKFNETPYNAVSGYGDTGRDTLFDTADTPGFSHDDTDDTPGFSHTDTTDTALEAENDTPVSSKEHPKAAFKSDSGTPNLTKASYTLAEVKHFATLAVKYKQEYNEFVNSVLNIHLGNQYAFISQQEYHRLPHSAERLLDSAKHLAVLLGEDYQDLLVTHVLQSIQLVVNSIITGRDPVMSSYGSYNLGTKVRALQFWKDSTQFDFLHPAFGNHE
jgi:hypothetical protein